MAQRLVLLRLADHADDSGSAWPGMSELRKYIGISEGTIRAAIHGLERAGFIWIEYRVTDRGDSASNLYRLLIGGATCEPPPRGGSKREGGSKIDPRGSNGDPRVGQTATHVGQTATHYLESLRESPNLESSKEPDLSPAASQPVEPVAAGSEPEQPSPRTQAPDLRHEQGERMTPPAPPRLTSRPEPPAGQQAQLALVAPPEAAPARTRKATRPKADSAPVRDSYSAAWEKRYGEPPALGPEQHKGLKRLIGQFGVDAAAKIAAFYLTLNKYAEAKHPVWMLVRDGQAIKLQMRDGAAHDPRAPPILGSERYRQDAKRRDQEARDYARTERMLDEEEARK
jgi:hypothetical protein